MKFPTTISKSGETIKIPVGRRSDSGASSSSIDNEGPEITINTVNKGTSDDKSSSLANSFNMGLYFRAMSLRRKKQELS